MRTHSHMRLLCLALLCLSALSLCGCASVQHLPSAPSQPSSDGAGVVSTPALTKLEANLSDCRAENYDCVSLLYGTNRAPKQGKDKYYGKAPLPSGHAPILGEVVVVLPAKTRGETASAARGQNSEGVQRRKNKFAIWGGEAGPQELTRSQFEELTRARLEKISTGRKSAFVYIHGFKDSFESTAFDAAQLKTDLRMDGPAFFFSWPSNDNGAQYLSDQQDADFSAQALVDFLRVVKNSVGETTELNIIAHSMGHRVVGQAFEILRRDAPQASPFFETGIFAAADLDENLFDKWIVGPNTAPPLVKKPIIYVTDDDILLNLSKRLLLNHCHNGDPKYRVGLVTKKDCETGERRVPVFSKPFETVDLSNEPGDKFLRVFNKNHFKHSKTPKAICHMARLFDGGEVSDFEDGDIVLPVETDSGRYWVTDKKRKVDWATDCAHRGDSSEIFPISQLEERAPRNLSP